MKARIFAGASLLLALATPAHAKGFAWCQVNGSNYQAYLSAIVEIDDGPAAYRGLTGQFGKAFQDYVRSSLDPESVERRLHPAGHALLRGGTTSAS